MAALVAPAHSRRDGDAAAGGVDRESFGYRLRLVVVPGVDYHRVASGGLRHGLPHGR